jgi:hypothetical protein
MGKDVEVYIEQPKPLSTREKMKLAELERRIVQDFGAFYRVGIALTEIRDSKLYRENHPTFESYCKDLWDMARGTAYRFIGAAEVYENIKSMSPNWRQNDDDENDLLPLNEAQVRPLTKLEPQQQKEIWRAAVESAPKGKITAGHVNKVVKGYLGEKVEKTTKAAKSAITKTPGLGVSEEFKVAFDAFIDQLANEKKAGYKNTSRAMIVKHLDALRQVIAEDGTKIEDAALPMSSSDAHKVVRAGFTLFRSDRSSKCIKILSEKGSWCKHSGPFATYKELDADFALILQDEKHLQG